MRKLWRGTHGDYGVTVNTGACGALDSSSILDSRPDFELSAIILI